MRVETHKHYDKMWSRLSRQQQLRVLAALKLLMSGQTDGRLRVHQLKGKYYPQYSLSAGGDLRVHYRKLEDDRLILMMVGTHAQLYG